MSSEWREQKPGPEQQRGHAGERQQVRWNEAKRAWRQPASRGNGDDDRKPRRGGGERGEPGLCPRRREADQHAYYGGVKRDGKDCSDEVEHDNAPYAQQHSFLRKSVQQDDLYDNEQCIRQLPRTKGERCSLSDNSSHLSGNRGLGRWWRRWIAAQHGRERRCTAR